MTVARTICLGFLAVITVGTLLLWLPPAAASGQWSPFVTALFTATSAVCVTGLSVLDVGTYYSGWGQGVLLMLVQVGGLGYMTATTFLLLLLGRRFGIRDKIALQRTLDTPGMAGVQQLVKSIVGLTLVVELTGAFLLLPAFVPDYGFGRGLWYALFHGINSFNNAGFSLFPDSFVRYRDSPLLVLTVTASIVVGGVGYQALMELYAWARSQPWRRWQHKTGDGDYPERFNFSLNFKMALSTSVVLWLGGTVLFLAIELHNPNTLGPLPWSEKLMAAWFQSVTTRTAGFNTLDIGGLTATGVFVTVAFMFVGANPGSTGGGLKTTTFRVLLNCTQAVLRGKEVVLAYQRQIPTALVLKAIAVLMGSMGTVAVAMTLLTFTDGNLLFGDLLFEVVSAFATVGLSRGITADFSLGGRLVLIVVMYVGRVGILLTMAALVGEPGRSSVRYPEEELLIG